MAIWIWWSRREPNSGFSDLVSVLRGVGDGTFTNGAQIGAGEVFCMDFNCRLKP